MKSAEFITFTTKLMFIGVVILCLGAAYMYFTATALYIIGVEILPVLFSNSKLFWPIIVCHFLMFVCNIAVVGAFCSKETFNENNIVIGMLCFVCILTLAWLLHPSAWAATAIMLLFGTLSRIAYTSFIGIAADIVFDDKSAPVIKIPVETKTRQFNGILRKFPVESLYTNNLYTFTGFSKDSCERNKSVFVRSRRKEIINNYRDIISEVMC